MRCGNIFRELYLPEKNTSDITKPRKKEVNDTRMKFGETRKLFCLECENNQSKDECENNQSKDFNFVIHFKKKNLLLFSCPPYSKPIRKLSNFHLHQ